LIRSKKIGCLELLDLYLEPVAPMLQMGLMSGKQQIINTLEQAPGDCTSALARPGADRGRG